MFQICIEMFKKNMGRWSNSLKKCSKLLAKSDSAVQDLKLLLKPVLANCHSLNIVTQLTIKNLNLKCKHCENGEPIQVEFFFLKV